MRGAARTSFFAIAYLQRIFYKFFFFFKENGGVTRWRHPSRSNNSLRATLFSSIHEEEEEDFFTTPPGFAPLIKGKYFFPLRWMQSIEKWHPGVKKHGDGVSKKKRIFFFFWSGKLSSSGERMSQASDYFRAHLLISFLGPV